MSNINNALGDNIIFHNLDMINEAGDPILFLSYQKVLPII